VNAILRIVIAVFLGFLVLALSSMMNTLNVFTQLSESYPWIPITHTGMLLASLILICLLSKGKVSTYGLKGIRLKALVRPTVVALVFGIIITALGELLPMTGFEFMEDFTLLQIILFVWIYASVSEELLTRGLLQGFLRPLDKYGLTVFNFYMSVPVLVAALFFGLMHLGLLTMGASGSAVLVVVLSGIILGVIAGYYRERTESIVPAIVVHALFNICGTVIGFLGEAVKS
jgi:membrane protease YdiL (CAAX protease family)